ncbi:DUF502 domain-containing protein [Candidatus Kuenenia sp.]|uniref:DUF502 domain-containing protein n=1 Tax=Candidatus Kuenenia sp. TaxID=2499824 RepID=UPI0032208F50
METLNKFFNLLKTDIRKRMLTGLLLILPIYVTFFVVKFLFSFIGGTLSPLIKRIFLLFDAELPKTSADEFIITFIGLIFTFASLYFIGIFAANIIGKSIIHYSENLLTKTPVISNIYSTVKQIVHAVSLPGKQAFKRVIILDFPKEGTKAIGFVTGSVKENGKEIFISVFVPTTPNPTSGFLIYTTEDAVIDTNLTVEDAFKTLLSGGVLTPKQFATILKTPPDMKPSDKNT